MAFMLVNTILELDDVPTARLEGESDEAWIARNMAACKHFLHYATEVKEPVPCRKVDEAPRDGFLLHFSEGNGCTELILKSDPPEGGMARALKALAEMIEENKNFWK